MIVAKCWVYFSAVKNLVLWHSLSAGFFEMTVSHYNDLMYQRGTKTCLRVSDSSIRFVNCPRAN